MGDTAERTLMVVNELGMHARAATKFVQLAAKFPCEIHVAKDGHEVNGKSIMGVLMLVASKGSQIVIKAKGDRSTDAVAALAQLVQDKFGEDR
ncbi:MAG: HPr family phosphocarrier protein [Deltaproteobacteria bacterium]|nr:HPr family phosphocarrier protein [Deltaproteobacteria bacterium]